jgi:hypothetical protein
MTRATPNEESLSCTGYGESCARGMPWTLTLDSTHCHDRTKVPLLLDLSSPTLKGCKPQLPWVQVVNWWFQDYAVLDPHNPPGKDSQYTCTICNQS